MRGLILRLLEALLPSVPPDHDYLDLAHAMGVTTSEQPIPYLLAGTQPQCEFDAAPSAAALTGALSDASLEVSVSQCLRSL